MIDQTKAIFIAIDFQERLMPAMDQREILEDKVIRLCRGINEFGIPKLVTTQYRKGIGDTQENIAEALGDFKPIDKTTFSVFGNEQFCEEFAKISEGKNIAIVCGVETHICLQQSVLDLVAMGYQVYIPCDCVGSRHAYDKEMALHRLDRAGCILTTYESILYELLVDSKNPQFKAVTAIVK